MKKLNGLVYPWTHWSRWSLFSCQSRLTLSWRQDIGKTNCIFVHLLFVSCISGLTQVPLGLVPRCFPWFQQVQLFPDITKIVFFYSSWNIFRVQIIVCWTSFILCGCICVSVSSPVCQADLVFQELRGGQCHPSEGVMKAFNSAKLFID